MPRRSSPLLLRLGACALPAVLSGCFTMALWGAWPEPEQDPITGKSETTFEYDADTEWSWDLLAMRVLLTPFTLGLDCLTCPVQAALGLCDCDDDHGHGREAHR